jgi:hypothetical protein
MLKNRAKFVVIYIIYKKFIILLITHVLYTIIYTVYDQSVFLYPSSV